MKVANINGTSEANCSCGSWIKHWEKFSGKTLPTYCYEKSCTKKYLVGAHVQKADGNSKWYICPLCSAHNKSGGTLEVVSSATLVSANKSETCGK